MSALEEFIPKRGGSMWHTSGWREAGEPAVLKMVSPIDWGLISEDRPISLWRFMSGGIRLSMKGWNRLRTRAETVSSGEDLVSIGMSGRWGTLRTPSME